MILLLLLSLFISGVVAEPCDAFDVRQVSRAAASDLIMEHLEPSRLDPTARSNVTESRMKKPGMKQSGDSTPQSSSTLRQQFSFWEH